MYSEWERASGRYDTLVRSCRQRAEAVRSTSTDRFRLEILE